MTSRPTIHTPRLVLRPCHATDADAVQDFVSSIEIARNTISIPHPYPEGGAAEWLMTHEEKFTSGREVIFGIVANESGAFAGIIGLVLKPHDCGELGYWIGEPFWGRGYATEAAGAVIDYGFRERPLNRIEAAYFARNPASGRVMEKNGMTREGTLRESVKKWDEYVDCEMYSILRREWIQGRETLNPR